MGNFDCQAGRQARAHEWQENYATWQVQWTFQKSLGRTCEPCLSGEHRARLSNGKQVHTLYVYIQKYCKSQIITVVEFYHLLGSKRTDAAQEALLLREGGQRMLRLQRGFAELGEASPISVPWSFGQGVVGQEEDVLLQ